MFFDRINVETSLFNPFQAVNPGDTGPGSFINGPKFGWRFISQS
jgi:hypothetical protein